MTSNADWQPVVQDMNGVEMVLVPAGCFMMGSEDGDRDEEPVHEQCFDTPFWIDRFEVTNAQFVEFLNAEGNQAQEGDDYLAADDATQIRNNDGVWEVVGGYEQHPVVEVAWYGARDFCLWRDGRPPTEREWEYAARGPDALIYPWGNKFESGNVVFEDNSDSSSPVGSRSGGVSWVGAYDLSGNVWEWVGTISRDYPYDPTAGREELFPVIISSVPARVLRGGSFMAGEDNLRAANRRAGAPFAQANEVGFRCGRDVETESADAPAISSRVLGEHLNVVTAVAFGPDGTQALSGGNDRALKLWDVATGEVIRKFEGHKDSVRGVAFSPDGRLILSGSALNDKTVRIWDASTGDLIRELVGHKTLVQCVAFSPDSTKALSCGGLGDKTVKMWDVETGALLHSLEGHGDAVSGAAFSPDGTRIVSSSADKTLRLWDVETGELLHTFEGHTDRVSSVAFSPDGTRILSGSSDQTLRLWDVETGDVLRTFEGHTDSVYSVAFSPDGKTVLSGSKDKTLRLWDVETGEVLRTFEGHTDAVYSVAFSPDGKTALSGSADKTVRIWDITGES